LRWQGRRRPAVLATWGWPRTSEGAFLIKDDWPGLILNVAPQSLRSMHFVWQSQIDGNAHELAPAHGDKPKKQNKKPYSSHIVRIIVASPPHHLPIRSTYTRWSSLFVGVDFWWLLKKSSIFIFPGPCMNFLECHCCRYRVSAQTVWKMEHSLAWGFELVLTVLWAGFDGALSWFWRCFELWRAPLHMQCRFSLYWCRAGPYHGSELSHREVTDAPTQVRLGRRRNHVLPALATLPPSLLRCSQLRRYNYLNPTFDLRWFMCDPFTALCGISVIIGSGVAMAKPNNTFRCRISPRGFQKERPRSSRSFSQLEFLGCVTVQVERRCLR
jgi:hypothetical protein